MAMTSVPFFVYGTLMKGFRNYEKHVSHYKSLRFIKSTWYVKNAQLYHFPQGYPGMYPSQDGGKVYGEVLTVDDPAEYAQLLSDLDALEEYFGPNDLSNEYDRVQIQVFDQESNAINAWEIGVHL
ncbi:hypothetical protein THRCLA_21979 [Thraustotheca clavata]|uniref:Gamma-glutamylcyclotransferase AIG2-like domain-containing protein n=1 Tax=Thraustotheca clavata TaxID=74557 RepID=A0A1V9ZFS0_9STRA|nr:hypothetical protein THRCLA_21979 [Thraustotheca clavata]